MDDKEIEQVVEETELELTLPANRKCKQCNGTGKIRVGGFRNASGPQVHVGCSFCGGTGQWLKMNSVHHCSACGKYFDGWIRFDKHMRSCSKVGPSGGAVLIGRNLSELKKIP